LNLGIGDDYFMNRGVTDPGFVLMPHDLDTILDSGGNVNGNIFAIVNGGGNYNGVDGLKRFFNHPEVTARYQQAMLDMMNSSSIRRHSTHYSGVLAASLPRRIDAMNNASDGGSPPCAPRSSEAAVTAASR
jgi:hypothetical protein